MLISMCHEYVTCLNLQHRIATLGEPSTNNNNIFVHLTFSKIQISRRSHAVSFILTLTIL